MFISADIAHCFDRSFAWDANTEPDMAGYNIYYKNGVSGAPYDGTGADEGNSPIQIPLASLIDPENPEYTLHGLRDFGTFYFVITAYDIYGNESGFSIELSFQPSSPQPIDPTNVAVEEISQCQNVVVNPDFESGKSPWSFYTNGTGNFNISSSAYEGLNAARITLNTTGTNMQFNQTNISLEPNTDYELSFAAYSNTGHDLQVFLHKDTSPYTDYGLVNLVNLTTSWSFYTISFTTDNFSDPVDDARLRFWFVNNASNGDEYWIDNVVLCKAGEPPPPRYDLTVGVSGSYGTVSPTSGTYPSGTVVQLTAFPDTGYRVAAWSGTNDDSSTSNTNTVTINEDKTVTVEFEEILLDNNVVINPSFENGASPWKFYTNGTGSFNISSSAYEGTNAARITLATTGTNMQFNQTNISLEPNTDYELSFAAYSNTGHDLQVFLHKDTSPYTDYGLVNLVNLTTSWSFYTISFTTDNFSDPVDDARLRFWFVNNASNGDEYWIDNVVLCKAGEPPPPRYDLTVGVSGSYGTVSPTSGTYPSGTVVQLTAFPDTGYRVAAWSGTNDDSSTSNTNTVTINEDKTVTVEFEEILLDNNVVINPSFENGASPWKFYTNGTGSFNVTSPACEGFSAAHISTVTTGTNIQFYQADLPLKPNTDYELSFCAYSNTGHDLRVTLIQHVSPYSNYGLSRFLVNLTTSWNTYTINFKTNDFAGPVNDARLSFWLATDANAGDEYWIDYAILNEAH